MITIERVVPPTVSLQNGDLERFKEFMVFDLIASFENSPYVKHFEDMNEISAVIVNTLTSIKDVIVCYDSSHADNFFNEVGLSLEEYQSLHRDFDRKDMKHSLLLNHLFMRYIEVILIRINQRLNEMICGNQEVRVQEQVMKERHQFKQSIR